MNWKRIIDSLDQHFTHPGMPLYKLLGVRPQFLSDVKSGKSQKPNAEFLVKIITKLGINPEWFDDESKPMFLQVPLVPVKSRIEQEFEEIVASHPKFTEIEERLTQLEKRLESQNSHSGDFTAEASPEYQTEDEVKIPYVHDIAAGPPIDQNEDQSDFVAVEARLIKKREKYYAASIRGTSMIEAGIRNGDLVLIRCTNVPRDGAIQVVSYNGKSTLKRFREIEGKGWELHYEDGSGQVIPADSVDYQVQGEFVVILPGNTSQPPPQKAPGRARSR